MTWKTCRYRRRNHFFPPFLLKKTLLLVFLAVMLIFGFQAGSRVAWNFFSFVETGAGVRMGQMGKLVGIRGINWKDMLGQVLPLASYIPDYIEDESTGFLVTAMQDIATADLNDPKTFFVSQIALFDRAQPVTAEPEVIPEGDQTGEDFPPAVQEPETEVHPPGKDPLIAVYCTHSAESYLPSQGVEKLEGKNGGVFYVAQRLKNTLEEKYGIGVVQSSMIHDYPDWEKSYANSLKTVEQIKKDYPSVQIFIDVHRDALVSRASTAAEINGQTVSKIMFIVGSDTRLPHPNWRSNLAFAQKLAAQMDKMYPGLLKGVRVQDGRYNQHVSPRAILVEMGATQNSMEEAERAAEMLAGVINNVLTSGS